MRKEKNREKAQIFRQRKKEYITSLEKKVEELEAKVCDLTAQLQACRSEAVFASPEAEIFPEINFCFDDFTVPDVKIPEGDRIEDLCGDQEKLMLLLNTLPVNENKECFKYFGKMGMCMKTEILKSNELNDLERFMLESDMSPEEVKSVFHTESLTKLNQAMKWWVLT